MSALTAEQRAARLIRLYEVSSQVAAEIRELEDAIDREQAAMTRARKAAAEAGVPMGRKPAQCGTESGYTRHRRKGEPACQACLLAHRTAERRRAQQRKTAA